MTTFSKPFPKSVEILYYGCSNGLLFCLQSPWSWSIGSSWWLPRGSSWCCVNSVPISLFPPFLWLNSGHWQQCPIVWLKVSRFMTGRQQKGLSSRSSLSLVFPGALQLALGCRSVPCLSRNADMLPSPFHKMRQAWLGHDSLRAREPGPSVMKGGQPSQVSRGCTGWALGS